MKLIFNITLFNIRNIYDINILSWAIFEESKHKIMI